jgi:hypothetical protein
MKKSVLLGIAAVLIALPAFAGEKKIESWDGYWTWYPQLVKEFPVKLKIPWFIKIVNEKDWVLTLVQVTDCDFPCFRACKQLQIACNFNLTLSCKVENTVMGGSWSCWFQNPGANIDMPGGNTDVCVQVKKADLLDSELQSKAGTTIQVATLQILVVPR